MNVHIENGKLTIDVRDLLAHFTDAERADLIDSLACRDEVINEVMNQVIDGWTSRESHGSTGYGGDPDATSGIDGARMRIAKASSDIAAKEIERLAHALERAEARINEGWAAYQNLLNQRREYA